MKENIIKEKDKNDAKLLVLFAIQELNLIIINISFILFIIIII